MRRLALVVVALLLVWAGGDPLFCPDGCGDEPIGERGDPTETGAQCELCLNASEVSVLPGFVPSLYSVGWAGGRTLSPEPVELPQIEHPPRP